MKTTYIDISSVHRCGVRFLKSIRNEFKKRQQEQWARHLYKSSSKICKLTILIQKILVLFFNKFIIPLIVLVIIFTLLIRLMDLIFNTNFSLTKDELEKIINYVFAIVNIMGLLLLFGSLYMLFDWLSRSGGGTVVLPFEDTTASQSEEKNNKNGEKSNRGKAIADSLVSELHRIDHIYTKMSQTIRIGEYNIESQRLAKFNFPRLTSIQENIESHLTDVATFEVGKTSFSIGKIILILKWLWPCGGVNKVISGSIQNYNSTTRLVVRLDYQNQVQAWEVTWNKYQKESINEKIKDLAYKVAMSLAPDITAQTWDGFKFFTEAIFSYYQYQQTGTLVHLHTAEYNCKQAYQAERKYEKLDDLFYKIGRAYFEKNKNLYENAKEAFDLSIEINTKNEYSHTGLGNVYYAQENFKDAIKEYERAKRLNEDFPYAANGLGNVYFQQGEFEKARDQYKYACKTNDEYWHDHFWRPYYNLGIIYLYGDEENLTDYKKAEKKFTEAKDVNKYLKDTQELHSVHSGLALTYLFQAIDIIDPLRYVQREINQYQYQSDKEKGEFQAKSKLIEMQEYENQLKRIEGLCNSPKDNLYNQLLNVNYSDRIQAIKEKLKQARDEIDQAADIALDQEAYICWNLGLITLVQSKIDEKSINIYKEEVCNTWQKALEIVYNNQNNQLCIPIYNDALKAVQEQNTEYLTKSQNDILTKMKNSQCSQTKGGLKVMLKDVEIILHFLKEK